MKDLQDLILEFVSFLTKDASWCLNMQVIKMHSINLLGVATEDIEFVNRPFENTDRTNNEC